MFSRTANGRRQLQIALTGLVLVMLFVVGFQLSGLIFRPPGQSTDTALTPETSSGGVGVVSPPKPLRDFTLTGKTGAPIHLSDLRGRTVVMFFGYTYCPDVCPLTMVNLKRVKQLLGDQASQVAFVFVSVDPKRDTPDQINRYINQFDSDFIGMTGSEQALRALGADYGLVFERESITTPTPKGQAEATEQALDPENDFVQHTSALYLIDRKGFLRMVAFFGTQPATLADQVRSLVTEPA